MHVSLDEEAPLSAPEESSEELLPDSEQVKHFRLTSVLITLLFLSFMVARTVLTAPMLKVENRGNLCP